MVVVFLCCNKRQPYKEIPSSTSPEPHENGGPKINGNGFIANGGNGTVRSSGKRRGYSTADGVTIDRPPGMVNGLSVCTSYKNRWVRLSNKFNII
jgi:hypothetical protein